MAFTNPEKIDKVLIYGEARGQSELGQQIYAERFSSKDISQCTNLCKPCGASSRFRAFRNELARVLGVLQINWEFLSL
jgi:hypothetical protein